MHENGSKYPDHTYVPWVLVDGKRDVNAEKSILDNLIKYTCDLAKENKQKIEGCLNLENDEYSWDKFNYRKSHVNFIQHHCIKSQTNKIKNKILK